MFNVTVVRKTSEHIFYNKGSKLGYLINTQQAPTIYLKAYQTYTFNINTAGHPFYFTTSETGAQDATGNVLNQTSKIITKGSITINPSEDFNNVPLYYQCTIHPNMGGRVVIQSECDTCKKVTSKLFTCSDCGQAIYCSVACQNENWNKHSLFCEGLIDEIHYKYNNEYVLNKVRSRGIEPKYIKYAIDNKIEFRVIKMNAKHMARNA